jgi:4-oxalocrotonate tautomerase family enzyme
MPFVTVHLLAGRSEDQKANAAAAIAEALAKTINVEASKTQVVFLDIPASSWAHGAELVSRRSGSNVDRR